VIKPTDNTSPHGLATTSHLGELDQNITTYKGCKVILNQTTITSIMANLDTPNTLTFIL